LEQLHRELMDLNPSAARSLAEGLWDSGRSRTPFTIASVYRVARVIE
jgi:hypothetical protein